MKGVLLAVPCLTLACFPTWAQTVNSNSSTAAAHIAGATCSSGTTGSGGLAVAPNYAASAGGFGSIDGTMYSPAGTVFVPHGINVLFGSTQPSAAEILKTDPGTNFVRLAVYRNSGGGYPSAASLKPYVDDLTAHGIFVMIEDHSDSTGQNSGGGAGVIFTGQLLQQELAFYSDVGSTFKTNPYVGAATTNEPAEAHTPGGPADPAALSAWQMQIYQAFRNAGNNNPVWIEVNGWADAASFARADPKVIGQMTNIRLDMHVYPWLFNKGAPQSQDAATLASYIASAQKIQSEDGKVGVDILEYGNSTDGRVVDPNWQPVVDAVHSAPGIGTAAWAWGFGGAADSLSSTATSYGASVTAHIATAGATGCPVSPLPPLMVLGPQGTPVTSPADPNMALPQTTPAIAGPDLIAPKAVAGPDPALPTIEDIDALVQNIPQTNPTLPSIEDVEQIALKGTTPSTDGPQGQYTPPTPPAGPSTPLSATGDFGTLVDTRGAHSIAVSGTGNTLSVTGGPQTIDVTGYGNAIRTGLFNDTITLHTGGNTIDGGGGEDTVVLAYPSVGAAAPVVTSATAGLSRAGNTIVAPPPGQGGLTIQGKLNADDRINVSKMLASTTWNGSPSTMWNYMTATSTTQGCTLSVNGKVTVLIPAGVGNIGPYIVAGATT